MLANFDPTLLLVMQHNVTGLKYFCKTSVLDRVNWYKGSGTRWTNHLNVHGRDVSVGVMGLYTDKQKCLEAALKFSTDNNIANSDCMRMCISLKFYVSLNYETTKVHMCTTRN